MEKINGQSNGEEIKEWNERKKERKHDSNQKY
jgi:hypothetical protein